MNTNFKVIGLTRLGIKPKSIASEANALTTLSSELELFYESLTGQFERSVASGSPSLQRFFGAVALALSRTDRPQCDTASIIKIVAENYQTLLNACSVLTDYRKHYSCLLLIVSLIVFTSVF